MLGYIFFGALSAILVWLAFSIYKARNDIAKTIGNTSTASILALGALVAFFIAFSLLYVHPAEQLFFDENIYQGIAINILHSGNAEWCQYGTGLLTKCYYSVIYHDPVGYPFILSIAFYLFGIGIGTAYSTQLLMGALSIFLFFIMSKAVYERSDVAATSTAAFTFIPSLYIWSRTEAVLDLPFMTFSILAFLAFVVFIRRQNKYTFSLFLSALAFVMYIRIEALLLVVIFAVLYLVYGEDSAKRNVKRNISRALHALDYNTWTNALIIIFLMLVAPELFFVAMQYAHPNYGQVGPLPFSLADFWKNVRPNFYYLLGEYNSINNYPAVFPQVLTFLAVIGLIYLLLVGKNLKLGLALPGLWFLTYELFYDFYYAGAATYGVDSRFMLQINPAMALLGGIGIIAISDALSNYRLIRAVMLRRNMLIEPSRYVSRYRMQIAAVTIAISVAIFLIYPFYTLLPNVTILPSNMPQQIIVHPTQTFLYGNYSKVPANCLVFSLTPDIWYELNRSAAQMSFLVSPNATFVNNTKSYTCHVLDYGYWCVVPPYHNTICSYILSHYDLKPIALQYPQNPTSGAGIYMIMNYSN